MIWMKYNPSECCVKCGRDGSQQTLTLLAAERKPGYFLPERFTVECRRCLHKWHRLPLDADVFQVNYEQDKEAQPASSVN